MHPILLLCISIPFMIFNAVMIDNLFYKIILNICKLIDSFNKDLAKC